MTKKKNEYQEKFEGEYKRLNPQQKKAVDTIDGPVVVVAGPGTGKTQILTLRIANIIDRLGADVAVNILALTFTNAGVFAMRERLTEFIGVEMAYQVNIFTFHSFAEEQIKSNPDYFSRFAFSQPATDIQQIQIVEELIQDADLEYLKTFASDHHYTRDIISAIGDLKMEAISPDDFRKSLGKIEGRILAEEGDNAYLKRKSGNRQKGDIKKAIEDKISKQKGKQEELADIYEEYQAKLEERKLYDFSDMILTVVQEAEKNEEYRSLLQEQYQYLLVDEHQDTNSAQNKMIELIGSAEVNENKPNIFTVGDEKQAIYAFQGASLDNFLKFKKQYDDVEIVKLESNYRSSQKILDSAHSVLAGEIELQAKNENVADLTHKIKVAELNNYKEELIFLAESVKKRVDSGEDPDSIAVFYRQNKNLFEIKDIFDKFKIPYKVFSRENILDNKEIKKLIMYMRAIANPYNDETLAKLLFVDFLNLDTFDILKVLRKMDYRGRGSNMKNKSILKIISSPEILEKIEVERPIEFLGLSNKLKECRKKSEDSDFLEFFEWFIKESGFLKHILKLADSASALKRLEKIFDEARKQFFSKKEYKLKDFLEYIDILEKYNVTIDLGQDNLGRGVNLMTAHGSKGLEFNTVYITNFVDSIWPGRRYGASFKLPTSKVEGGIDDERRLFYVALTRGKQEVLITYSKLDLESREKKVSRFLSEIDDEFIKNIDVEQLKIAEKVNTFFQPREEQALSVFSLDYVKEQFLKNTLSVSALNNYMQSPLKYFFRNLLRLPSTQTKTLIFGNIIHQTLEDFFKTSKKAKKLLSEKELLKHFQKVLDSTIMLEKYYDESKRRGKKLLKEYYQNYKGDFTLEIETEKKVFASMKLRNGETLKLYGIVDKVELLSGSKIRVVDYKTGRSYKDKFKDEREDLHRQLVFYKLLLDKYHEKTGHPEIKVEEGMLDFVEKSRKTGEFERKILAISPAEVKELEEQIQDFAEDILSGEFLKQKYERDKNTEDFFDLWSLRK
jgi:DNA helicase-2/ATP-dependent DNA helicase PcrA